MDQARCSNGIQWIKTQLILTEMIDQVPESFPHHDFYYPIRRKVCHRGLGILRAHVYQGVRE